MALDDRTRDMLAAFRKRIRVKAREAGLAFDPNASAPILDARDALGETSAEDIADLIRAIDHERRRLSVEIATLRTAAAVGLSIETSMHELYDEQTSALGALKRLHERLDAPRDKALVEEARRAVERVCALNLSLYPFSPRHDRSGRPVTGALILERLEHLFERVLARKSLTIEASESFRGATPPGSEATLVPVFVNLLRNAHLWGARTNGTACVLLDARMVRVGDRDEPVLAVSDNGPGIDAHMRERIFQPFVSGRMSAGIGLYLCRALLEQCRLAIRVEEAPSPLGGATFAIGHRDALLGADVRAYDVSAREGVLMAGIGLCRLALAGSHETMLGEHSEDYGRLATEALRVRLAGARDDLDRRIGAVHETLLGIVEGRLCAADLAPFLSGPDEDQRAKNG